MPLNPMFKTLIEFAGRKDWAWAAAVVQVESNWNPYAMGDSGLALGLFQMHPNFMADQFREYSDRGEMLILLSHDPFAQAEAFRRFWQRNSHLQVEDRLRVYHYGPTGAEKLKDQADPDPDKYVARVKAAYLKFQEN
ncbi:MAG: transglycosylase SLT domain-containing protein [Candidatus Binataceae bacterium]|nr:transglycosylase SLT domain-containing protein [Candidatus Binataceae bacterium]